ncbi:MAG: MATE family efflux transporter, partial [Firmicutes bacterium]|nr:MATE family efflux transporter [Bacillota bacterium]
MKKGSMFSTRDIAAIIWPIIIEQLLMVFMGMADTFMVSSAGDEAVSGISLVDSINVLIIQLFSALATGGAVVVAQYLGKRDNESAEEAAKQLIWMSSLISAGFSALSLAANRPLLLLIFGSIEQSVMTNCRIYFYVTAISFPFLAIYNSGAAIFRATGNSRISMAVSIISNLFNIAGNALLIYGFDMGVLGAALSTLLSRILSAVIMMLYIKRPDQPVTVNGLLKVRFNGAMIKRILSIGIPNGLEGGMFQGG